MDEFQESSPESEAEEPLSDEEVNEIISEIFGEMDTEDAELMFRRMDQDEVNDSREGWKFMYGFDHECGCAADAEADRFVKITECYAGACEEAFNELRRARGFLYAIATSPTKNAIILKRLADEAFRGEG